MGDPVVYEDAPIAEYLKSVESNEALVKPSPLQLGTLAPEDTMISIHKQFSESLYRFWRQSLFHDTFSVSLPIMEEMAFEEKFKYLIVTSHLLNDTLSTHPKQKTPPQAPPPFHTAAAYTRSATVGTVVTLTGLLAALGLEQYTPFQLQQNEQQQYEDGSATTVSTLKSITPTITMMLASSVSLFFVYRHLRRSSIRKLYQCALTRLQDVLEQSQLLDNKVHRALITIQEIELVSRGYRLSTPSSTPLPSITSEQASNSTRRCARLRSQLARLLRRAFIVYEEAIIDLSGWVNKPTLARFFDMYNIQSVASLSSATTTATNPSSIGDDDDNNNNNMEVEDDGITLDYLKTLAHLMHLKRRECMLQFLALSVMTGGHDSIRKGYETGWKNINSVLLMVKNETTAFAKDVKEALDNEFGQSPGLDRNETTTTGVPFSTHYTETQQFIHRLSLLDQHLRTTEARVYLCNDELQRRQRKPTHQALALEQQTLQKEYMAMKEDIQHLVAEWEAGKQALDTLLAPTTHNRDPLETPPSPLPSPTITPTTTNAPSFSFVVTSDEQPELLDWPLPPSNSSVYGSTGDILDGAGVRKKSRDQEVKEKESRMDN